MGEEDFCRLCAETKSLVDLLNIKDEYWSKQDLDTKILQFFQIKILPTDKLPRNICFKCCEKVNITWEFNEKVQQAQETLRSVLSEEEEFDPGAETEDSDSEEKIEDSVKRETENNSPPVDFVECVLSDSKSKNKMTKDMESLSDVVQISDINKRRKTIVKHKDGQKSIKGRSKGRKPRKKPSVTGSEDFGSHSEDDTLSVFSGASSAERNEDGSLNIAREGWDTYPWMCVECNERMESAVELRNHYQNVHNQMARYACVECPKVYTKYYGFVTHVRYHRRYLRFCCDACNKFYESRKVLEAHRATHLDARPYTCTTCGKTFRLQSALYVHARSHLPIEVKNKFACDQCPKKFATKPNLMAHKRIHTGIRDYTCDQCGKSFIQKGNLDNHMLTHIAARPFSCDTCGKSFKTLMRLKKHGSVHSGLKPHQCDVCGRQFRERGTLKEHHRIHTGAMPFTCEFCGKSFRFKGVLTTHRRQHTGERPYSCNECQHHFTNWPNYNKHMKRRHGINTSVTTRKPQTIPPTGMPNRNPPGTVVAPTASHVYVIQNVNTNTAVNSSSFVEPDPLFVNNVGSTQQTAVVAANTAAPLNQNRERVVTNTNSNLNVAGNIVNIQPAHLTQNYYMFHGLYNLPGINADIMQHTQHQ